MHPQGCQILNLDPLLFGLNHMPVKMALPAGLSPATWRFEAARPDTLSYGSEEGQAARLTRDSNCVGRRRYKGENQKAEASSPARARRLRNLSTILQSDFFPLEIVGCHGIAPCSRRLRAGTSLSKFATQVNAKVELNHRSQTCVVLAGTGISRHKN